MTSGALGFALTGAGGLLNANSYYRNSLWVSKNAPYAEQKIKTKAIAMLNTAAKQGHVGAQGVLGAYMADSKLAMHQIE